MRAAFALLFASALAWADDTALPTSLPFPKQSYLRLEPSYTFDDGGGQLFARGVLIYRGFAIPRVDADRFVSAVGVDLSVDHIDGISDLDLTQLSGLVFGWGVVGIGVAAELPTATAGDRATALGPALIAQYTALPHVELALLARTFFGVAGSTQSALVTRLEPAIVFALPGQFQLSSDGEIDIDWLAREVTLPINCELAHPLGDHVVVTLGPEVVVAGRERGSVKLDLRIDLLAK